MYLSLRNQMPRLFVGWPVSFRPRPQASTLRQKKISKRNFHSENANVFHYHYGGTIKNSHFPLILDLWETRSWKSRDYWAPFLSVFRPQENESRRYQIPAV